MARETKVQRDARIETEREQQLTFEQQEYPKRMMIALERASNNFNFELTVVEQQFYVQNRDTYVDFTISPTWNREVWELYALEDEMEKMGKQRQEEARKEQAITAALNKLTKEERELLELIPARDYTSKWSL